MKHEILQQLHMHHETSGHVMIFNLEKQKWIIWCKFYRNGELLAVFQVRVEIQCSSGLRVFALSWSNIRMLCICLKIWGRQRLLYQSAVPVDVTMLNICYEDPPSNFSKIILHQCTRGCFRSSVNKFGIHHT